MIHKLIKEINLRDLIKREFLQYLVNTSTGEYLLELGKKLKT
jgi:hypothetical protein